MDLKSGSKQLDFKRYYTDSHSPVNSNPSRTLPSHGSVPPPSDRSGSPDTGGDGDPKNELCTLVAVNLAALLDGELDADTNELVASHLSSCNRCKAEFEQIASIDQDILREWRQESPLPSSREVSHAIEGVMSALPPDTEEPVQFAGKRVHARLRWMRFSTGTIAILVVASAAWSGYKLGYARGSLRVVPARQTVAATVRPALSLF